jgi:hypothetical protein
MNPSLGLLGSNTLAEMGSEFRLRMKNGQRMPWSG